MEAPEELGTQGADPFYLRGYCRVCNRHYFYRHHFDTEHTQYHQHHFGVCQRSRYSCARIKPRPKAEVPLRDGRVLAAIPVPELRQR